MIDPDQEHRLAAALRSADRAARDRAMHELHDRLGRPLFQLCLRITCDAALAEDARQEAFVDLLRGIGSFRGDARLSTWLFRIAIRAASRVRGRRQAGQAVQLDDHTPVGHDDPVARSIERENATRLLAAIDRLPAQQRVVLGLASLQGMAHAEIAAVLGIPVGTVGSRLHEARERLRAALDPP